jgi:hypothetical protein
MELLTRRGLLTGLIAAPLVVPIKRLRGVVLPGDAEGPLFGSSPSEEALKMLALIDEMHCRIAAAFGVPIEMLRPAKESSVTIFKAQLAEQRLRQF